MAKYWLPEAFDAASLKRSADLHLRHHPSHRVPAQVQRWAASTPLDCAGPCARYRNPQVARIKHDRASRVICASTAPAPILGWYSPIAACPSVCAGAAGSSTGVPQELPALSAPPRAPSPRRLRGASGHRGSRDRTAELGCECGSSLHRSQRLWIIHSFSRGASSTILLPGKWDDSSIVDKAGVRSRPSGKLERVYRSRSTCPE
jgi:hypothetical protein